MDNWKEFIAGCLGGFAGVIAGHPFDTVKVRIVSDEKKAYKGFFHCFKTIVREEGFRGLYKGIAPPLYSLGFINAIVFGVQRNVLRQMEYPNSLQSHFIAGVTAGGVQSIVCGPMELVKIRMQNEGKGELSRVSDFTAWCKKIVKAEGVRGMGRGMVSTVLRDAPSFGTYFFSYEWLCRKLAVFGGGKTSFTDHLLAGGIAGCLTWLSTYPIDVIKTRIQGDGVYQDGKFTYKYKGYKDCITRSYKIEGWRVFFKGLNATLIRAFPTNAATLSVFTFSMGYLRPAETAEEMHLAVEAATAVSQLD